MKFITDTSFFYTQSRSTNMSHSMRTAVSEVESYNIFLQQLSLKQGQVLLFCFSDNCATQYDPKTGLHSVGDGQC